MAGQKPFAGYPSQAPRPSARGERYRISVMGPGVTPVLMWEGAGLPPYKTVEARANASFDRIMAGDRICARER